MREAERLAREVAVLARAVRYPEKWLRALAAGEPEPIARAAAWLASPMYGRPDAGDVRRAAGAVLRMMHRRVVVRPSSGRELRIVYNFRELLERGRWQDAALAMEALFAEREARDGATIVEPER